MVSSQLRPLGSTLAGALVTRLRIHRSGRVAQRNDGAHLEVIALANTLHLRIVAVTFLALCLLSLNGHDFLLVRLWLQPCEPLKEKLPCVAAQPAYGLSSYGSLQEFLVGCHATQHQSCA
jgi:hypothetical protein